MTVTATWPAPVARFVEAANSFDTDGFMAAFSDREPLVNDRHRQFWGKDAIRRWCEIEITGDHVTLKPLATSGDDRELRPGRGDRR